MSARGIERGDGVAEQLADSHLEAIHIAVERATTVSREQFSPKASLSSTEALILHGKERGYVTDDEVSAALPSDQMFSAQIEDGCAVGARHRHRR